MRVSFKHKIRSLFLCFAIRSLNSSILFWAEFMLTWRMIVDMPLDAIWLEERVLERLA